MTTFFMVRHAVTDHTGKRLSGWMDGISLTEQGREQAEVVADTLADVEFEAIYSSPIERTNETARAIASRHEARVHTRRALGEVEYGAWTNRSLRSLMKTKLWGTVQRFPSAARFPDGESLREVQVRALDEIERIAADHPNGNVCCVSHGDVIKLVLAHYIGVHIDLFQRIVVAPASVSVFSLSERGPLILSLNATLMSIPAKDGS
ncbi:MAG: MSMEG_4193 family putative phosphomutase [Actinobacteria bacterium]|nr:MSMEG_4193 family putative phosphomutase [Actinomycetota bacterium]